MVDYTTNWTSEELTIYTLIFCANADFSESVVEDDYIKSKITSTNFDKIHKEFEQDNDYTSIQKIQHSLERLGYTKSDKEKLLAEIKALFMCDEHFDILEQNTLLGLKHLFL